MPRADTQFKPGNKGRAKGTKNQRTVDILQVCQAVLMPTDAARRAYLANVRQRILAGAANHMELFLAQHLWGKPAEVVDADVTHRFVFVGFDDGGGVPLPPPLPRPHLPDAALAGDVDGPGEAGGDGVASPQW